MAAQQIARPVYETPGELVASLAAVQAQDAAAARWAVGLRLRGRNGAAGVSLVDRALADGKIIRTHVMRWTWQLVAPADLGWMLPLVTARLMTRAARRHRELRLDAATFRRSHAALARAFAGGAHRTRAELGTALRAAGVSPEGARLSHLLGHAELHGLICSGAPRGKQATYALVDERAPRGAPRTRAEAAAALARRYFESRGPATVADFAWWSGLAPAEARAGLAAIAGELASETVGGAVYWCAARAARLPDAALARAYLLPAFDEYLVAYRDRAAVLAPEHARRLNAGGGMLSPAIVVGGRVAGTWRRTFERRGTVTIALAPFAAPARRARDSIAEAAQRYAAFLGLEPRLVWPR